jgi:DNA-binding response OmpR family regulator
VPKVLVIDDDSTVADVVAVYLERAGMETLRARDGAEGLEMAVAERPDVILLDLMLPQIDGLEVCRRLRLRQPGSAIIMVTARGEEQDRVLGLEIGADDYVTKPFSPREVVARVKTVLRRSRTPGGDARPPADPDPVLAFEGLTIDEARREITRDGSSVTLSALEFDLLRALARSPGRVFSRAQLLEEVWGYDFYGDERVVDVHVRSIRRALGDDATDPRLVATVRGVGYKLIAEPRPGRRADGGG